MSFSNYISIVILLLLASCASYKAKYSADAKNWQQDSVVANALPAHTMYLVGDAGNDKPNAPSPVLNYLEKELKAASANSSIVFLGDNIYEYGMPPKEEEEQRRKPSSAYYPNCKFLIVSKEDRYLYLAITTGGVGD